MIEEPNCHDCPLTCRRTSPDGPKDAEIVVVTDAPGGTDKKMNRPLAGQAGNVFWQQIPEEMRSKIYTTFAIPCMSQQIKDDAVRNKAAKACNERLMSEIAAYPRKMIITLGNASSRSVTGDYGIKITQDRGERFPNQYSEFGVLPVISPQALLQGSGSLPQFRADIAYALELASGQPGKQFIDADYLVVTADNIMEIADKIMQFDIGAADIETGGFDAMNDEILCLGICVEPELTYMFPEELLEQEWCQKVLMQITQKVRLIWQNGKFDVSFLRNYGIWLTVNEDTMLLSYALDESPGSHGLKALAKNLLGAPDYEAELKKYLPNKKTSYRVIPKPVLYKYCGRDCSFTLQIWRILKEEVNADPPSKYSYENMLIPASEFLQRVESRGLLVDQEYLATLSDPDNPDSYYNKVENEKKTFQEIAGYPINPNSPKQVAKFFFDELKLPKKRGRSTDKKVMEMLPHHPAVTALQKHRKTSKLYGTYVKPVYDQLDPYTGCMHTTFKIHGSRTGRLASEKPNLQNVPRGPIIRTMFIPRPGYEFIEVDLNQAELRCLAQLSKCPDLCAIYNDPTHEGLHHEISRFLFGDDFTSEQKMRGKAVNFGIVYGREARSLADEFGVSLEEAQRWIDGWAKRFPGAWEFIQFCRNAAVKGQTLTTIFGRKMRNHLVTRERARDVQNQAANFPHQSIASDINLKAGINSYDELIALDVHPVILVHDSNILECPITPDNSIRDKAIKIMVREMEALPVELGLTTVPFLADAKVSQKSWGDLHDYRPQG